MSALGPKQATFCYRCGRRASKTMETCWYCGAPTSRWIRRPKRCPFCQEEVQPGAVKCRHCGEFIDGRAKQAEAPPPAQVVFVVDRNLLQSMQEARLLAGQPVPPDVARVLDAQTVRAIESGQPRLITQAGVRALPAPAGPDQDVFDAEPVAGSGRGLAVRGPGGAGQAGRPPAASEERALAIRPAGVPAVREEKALARSSGAAAGAGKALVKAGGWLARQVARRLLAGPPQPAPDDGILDADARELYRVCERCQTEILASDNFCFHCGIQYRDPKADIQALAPVTLGPRLRRGQFLLTVLLIAACGVMKQTVISVDFPYKALAAPAAAGLAVLISVYGVVAGRGFANKFFSLLLGAIAAAALWYAAFLA